MTHTHQQERGKRDKRERETRRFAQMGGGPAISH